MPADSGPTSLWRVLNAFACRVYVCKELRMDAAVKEQRATLVGSQNAPTRHDHLRILTPHHRAVSQPAMSSWAPLAPNKAGQSSTSRFGLLTPSKPNARGPRSSGPSVGRWPESTLLRIIHYVPIPDLPSFARANRAFGRLVRDESNWKRRCALLGLQPSGELYAVSGPPVAVDTQTTCLLLRSRRTQARPSPNLTLTRPRTILATSRHKMGRTGSRMSTLGTFRSKHGRRPMGEGEGEAT